MNGARAGGTWAGMVSATIGRASAPPQKVSIVLSKGGTVVPGKVGTKALERGPHDRQGRRSSTPDARGARYEKKSGFISACRREEGGGDRDLYIPNPKIKKKKKRRNCM